MKKAITTATAAELHSSFNLQPPETFRASNFYPVILSLSLSIFPQLLTFTLRIRFCCFCLKFLFFLLEIMPNRGCFFRKGTSREHRAFNIETGFEQLLFAKRKLVGLHVSRMFEERSSEILINPPGMCALLALFSREETRFKTNSKKKKKKTLICKLC